VQLSRRGRVPGSADRPLRPPFTIDSGEGSTCAFGHRPLINGSGGALSTNNTAMIPFPSADCRRRSAAIEIPNCCGNGHPLGPDNVRIDQHERRWRCRQCGRERGSIQGSAPTGGLSSLSWAGGRPNRMGTRTCGTDEIAATHMWHDSTAKIDEPAVQRLATPCDETHRSIVGGRC
jgi:hypothetical protein